jgi:hypothetical protein
MANVHALIFVTNMLDFNEQYRSMTDDELLNVARDSGHLMPEARNSLDGELSRRRITTGQITKYDHEQSNDPSDKKFNPETAYSLWPTLRRIRETFEDWKHYRNETGEWPRRSICFYFLHLVVELAVLLLIIWYSLQHGWSKGMFIVVLIMVVTVDVFLSNWLQNKIRLSEITRYRHARRL